MESKYPLHEACAKRNIEMVKELLREGKVDINEINKRHVLCDLNDERNRFIGGDGCSFGGFIDYYPINIAILLNSIEIVDLLLEEGCSLIIRSPHGGNLLPVELALIWDRFEIFKRLIESHRSEYNVESLERIVPPVPAIRELKQKYFDFIEEYEEKIKRTIKPALNS